VTEVTEEEEKPVTIWLRGMDLDEPADLWESVDAALRGYGPVVPVVVDPASYEEVLGAEFRERVERAAALLVRAGASPGDTVVLDLERGVDEVVFVLACVRQGLPYLGISTTTPVARHAPIVDDAAPAVVVTRRGGAWAGRVCVDPGERADAIAVPKPATGAEVCYISYTSGTTGRPKGVEATRAGVDRLARGADWCPLRAGERVLRFAPLAFDASTLELFLTLWRRATLFVGPRGPLDLDALAEFLVVQRVDVCWLTAGLFSSMVEHRPDAFAGLRQVVTGGDRVPAASVTALLHRFPRLSVVNGYGPTEVTTFATVRTFSRDDLPLTTVPIGRPIPGTDVALTDAGELLVAGIGLAVGYRGDPALTAERFPQFEGRRVYRTGDLVELVNGDLQFLGRRDRQLKVRGFRVEPGAVDEILADMGLVSESWTFGYRGTAGSEIVCAYVPARGADVEGSALRESMAAGGLPDHAVPPRLVKVVSLPLTANGKVDEAALVRGLDTGSDAAQPGGVPSDVRAEVRRCWAAALGTGEFEDHAGFFGSGGDSLRLAQLHAMLSDRFPEAGLRLVELLLHPSVAEQAETLMARHKGTAL
jgi:amino acid adenylation domain-containing protein